MTENTPTLVMPRELLDGSHTIADEFDKCIFFSLESVFCPLRNLEYAPMFKIIEEELSKYADRAVIHFFNYLSKHFGIVFACVSGNVQRRATVYWGTRKPLEAAGFKGTFVDNIGYPLVDGLQETLALVKKHKVNNFLVLGSSPDDYGHNRYIPINSVDGVSRLDMYKIKQIVEKW